MPQNESINNTEDYINYTFHISSKGVGAVAGELIGLSNTVSNLLGDIAFKTSEMLSNTEALAMGTSIAIGALFTSAIKDSIRFEQQMANVKAIGGESLNVQEIGNAAMEYSNKFGMATASMTEGLEALARAGITTTSVMKSVLEEGVKLSKLEGMDLEDSINDLIATTNLLSPDNVNMNDIQYAEMVKQMNQHIVSTSESAPINAQNIIQSLQHVGGYASASGMDQDDLFAVIAQLGARGTKGEMAGTALRAFIAAGQKDTAQRALARIGLNVSDLWNDNGETMLSISEMKNVLDQAMEKRGYSKQEKLEFYSDFAGYKQANQIMKIDTSEVQQYKEQIANAWDLGKKLDTILGTVKGNLDRIWQITQNFMTKVGGKILFVANAILTPVRMLLELINKMPFADTAVAAGMIVVGFSGVLKIINNIVPRFSTFFVQLNQSKEDVLDIRNVIRQLPDDINKAKDTIRAIPNPQEMMEIQQKRQLYSQKEMDAVEEKVARLFYINANWNDPRFQEMDDDDRRQKLTQIYIGQDPIFQSTYINNLKTQQPEKWAEAVSSYLTKTTQHADNIAEESSYDIGDIVYNNNIMNIDRYVQWIWGILSNEQNTFNNNTVPSSPSDDKKNNRDRNARIRERQEAFREMGNNILNNKSEYGDYNYKVNPDINMPQFNYNDIEGMRRFEAQVMNEIQRKMDMYANFFEDSNIEAGRNRLKKSLTIAAKTDLGYEFSTGANTSDIKKILETGHIREGSSYILDEQLQAIADILETEVTGNKHEDMRRFSNILNNKDNKDELLESILKKTQKQWNSKYYNNGKVGFFPTKKLEEASGGATIQKIIEKMNSTGANVNSVAEVQEYFKNKALDDTLLNECVDIMYQDKQLVEELVKEEIKYMYENLARVQNSILRVSRENHNNSTFYSKGEEYEINLQKAREYVLADFNPNDFERFSASPHGAIGKFTIKQAIDAQNDNLRNDIENKSEKLEGFQGFIYPIGGDIARSQRYGNDNFLIRNIKHVPYNNLLEEYIAINFLDRGDFDSRINFLNVFSDWVNNAASYDGHYWESDFDWDYNLSYIEDTGLGFFGEPEDFNAFKQEFEEIYRAYIDLAAYNAQSLINKSAVYDNMVTYRGGRLYTPENDFGRFDSITSTSLSYSVAKNFWNKNKNERKLIEIYNPQGIAGVLAETNILNDQNNGMWARERELTLGKDQPYLHIPNPDGFEQRLLMLTNDQQKAVKEIMGEDFKFRKNEPFDPFLSAGESSVTSNILTNQLALALNKDSLSQDNIGLKLKDLLKNGAIFVDTRYDSGTLGAANDNDVIDINTGTIKYHTDNYGDLYGNYGNALLDTVLHEMTHVLMMHKERENYQNNNIPSELGIDNFQTSQLIQGYNTNFVAEYEAQYVSSQVLNRLGIETSKKNQQRLIAFKHLIESKGYGDQIQYNLLDNLVDEMLNNITVIGDITKELSTQFDMASAGITSAQVSEDMRPVLSKIQAFNKHAEIYKGPDVSSKKDEIEQTLSDMEKDMEILWNNNIFDKELIYNIVAQKYAPYIKTLEDVNLAQFLKYASPQFANEGEEVIHASQALSSSMIIDLFENNPNLKKITMPPSVYDRTSTKYLNALKKLDIEVEKKYNWGSKSKTNGLEYNVLQLSNEGQSPKQIAQQLNISANRVYYLLNKAGATFDNRKRKHNHDKVNILKEQGFSAKEISDQLNIPLSSVYYILSKNKKSFKSEGEFNEEKNRTYIENIWNKAANGGNISVLQAIKKHQLSDPLIRQNAPIFMGTWGDKRFNSHINQYLRRTESYADFDLMDDGYINPQMEEILTKYDINTVSALSTILSKTLLQTQGLPFDTRLFRRGKLNTASNNFGILTGVTSTAYEVGPTDAYANGYGNDLIEILAPAGTQGMNLYDWEYTLAPNTPYIELGQYGEATRILLLPPKQQQKYGFYPEGLDGSYRIGVGAAIANNYGIDEDIAYFVDGINFDERLYDNESITRGIGANGLYYYYNEDNDTILTSDFFYDLAEEIDESFINALNAILGNFNGINLNRKVSQEIVSRFISSRLKTQKTTSSFKSAGEDEITAASREQQLIYDSLREFKESPGNSRKTVMSFDALKKSIINKSDKETAELAIKWIKDNYGPNGIVGNMLGTSKNGVYVSRMKKIIEANSDLSKVVSRYINVPVTTAKGEEDVIQLPLHSAEPHHRKNDNGEYILDENGNKILDQAYMNKFIHSATKIDMTKNGQKIKIPITHEGISEILDSEKFRRLPTREQAKVYDAIIQHEGHTMGDVLAPDDKIKKAMKPNRKFGVLNTGTTGLSCPNRGECGTCDLAPYCYAARDAQRLPNVSKNQMQKALYFTSHSVDDIVQDIVKRDLSVVRINQEGDIPTLDELDKVIEIAKALPGVKFYGYTKSLDVLKYMEDNGLPKNLQINNSLGTFEKGNYVATSFHMLADYIEKGYRLCLGACADCEACVGNLNKVTLLRDGTISKFFGVEDLKDFTPKGQVEVLRRLYDAEANGQTLNEELVKSTVQEVRQMSKFVKKSAGVQTTLFANKGEEEYRRLPELGDYYPKGYSQDNARMNTKYIESLDYGGMDSNVKAFIDEVNNIFMWEENEPNYRKRKRSDDHWGTREVINYGYYDIGTQTARLLNYGIYYNRKKTKDVKAGDYEELINVLNKNATKEAFMQNIISYNQLKRWHSQLQDSEATNTFQDIEWDLGDLEEWKKEKDDADKKLDDLIKERKKVSEAQNEIIIQTLQMLSLMPIITGATKTPQATETKSIEWGMPGMHPDTSGYDTASKMEKENTKNIRALLNSLVINQGQRGIIQKLLMESQSDAVVQEIKKANKDADTKDIEDVAKYLIAHPVMLDTIKAKPGTVVSPEENRRRQRKRWEEQRKPFEEERKKKQQQDEERRQKNRESNTTSLDDYWWYRLQKQIHNNLGEKYYFGGEKKRKQTKEQAKIESWLNKGIDVGIKSENFVSSIFNKAAKQMTENTTYDGNIFNKINNFVQPKAQSVENFTNALEKLSEIFPILTPAVIGLNTALDGIKISLSVTDTLSKYVALIKGDEGAKDKWEKIKNDSLLAQGLDIARGWKDSESPLAQSIGNMVDGVVVQVNEILGGFIQGIIDGTLLPTLLPIVAVIGAIIVAVKAVQFWEKQHAKALKEAQEALKEATTQNNIALSQYKDLKKARENETDVIKKQQAARKEAVALYELETARINKRKAVHEESKLRNDTIWGEYGLRAELQKLGLGVVAGGDFQSQYENYDGTTANIRQIKESTMGKIFNFQTSNEQDYVASMYDKNSMFFAEVEAYKDPLQTLYDKESKLIEQYGSIDLARGSKEFYDAVQEFSDATGINGKTAGMMLDWLETENRVNQATQAMKAQVNVITARADAKALSTEDDSLLDDDYTLEQAMIMAQAQSIYQEAYDYMWWEKFQADLFGILWTILDHMVVWDWTDHATQYWKKSEAYEEGMKELAELGVRGVFDIGDEMAENADRRDYGVGSYTYNDSPFGAALESAELMETEYSQQMALERRYTKNETQKFQKEINEGMIQTGQSGVEGFKTGLEQHSPGAISRSMGDEMTYTQKTMQENYDMIMSESHQIGENSVISFKDGLGQNPEGNISKSVNDEMLYTQEAFENNREPIKELSYDIGYESGEQYGQGFMDGLKSLYEQISTPEALVESLEDRILVRQGYGIPEGANPNDPEIQRIQAEERAETESKLLVRSGLGSSILSAGKREGKSAWKVATKEGANWQNASVAGRVINSVEIAATDGLRAGVKALFAPKNAKNIPTGKIAGTVDDALKGAGKYGSKVLSKVGIDTTADVSGKALGWVARNFGDDAAKGVAKLGGKAAKAIPFLGTAMTAAFSIAEHNPFEKHYNEDGSEKRAFQSTGEVAGAIAGSLAADAVGIVAGPVAGMVAGFILEPIGEAIGGTIGWLTDEVVNTKFSDAWAGFNDALGGIPNQIVGFIDQSPIGQAGHFIFSQLDNLTGGWLGETWDKVQNSSIMELPGVIGEQLWSGATGIWDSITGANDNSNNPIKGILGLTPIGIGVNAASGIFNWLSGGEGKNDPYKNIGTEIGQKMPPNHKSENTVIIKNININTEDDPEKIKSALMNLIIEMQEQISPRQVSRTVGEPPAQSTSTTQDENNTSEAEGTDAQSGTENGDQNNNPTV